MIVDTWSGVTALVVITVTSHTPRYRTQNRTREGTGKDHGPRIGNVFDDLPPDLERLHTLRVWHALWIERIDRKIEALRQREREQERGRRNRPAPPEWIVGLGIGAGHPPVQVHAGDCYAAGKRRRPVDRDEARRLLATGLPGCTHCQPDVQLHIIDLAARRPPGRAQQHRRTVWGILTPAWLEQSCHSAGYPAGRRLVFAAQNRTHDVDSPSPGLRTGPVRADLPRRPGRPVCRMPAQDTPLRQRRLPDFSRGGPAVV
ncbi:DUF6233 domain-containing protein [Streptomyces aquilus]|uniref:DUF6233 domain-containing protein n=1 Tax=Streptomyces aquilus TaxID=2548456 RepID=UPI001FCC0018|nr:DUF6233 domain-containing protein [Streptomyces aquilus]